MISNWFFLYNLFQYCSFLSGSLNLRVPFKGLNVSNFLKGTSVASSKAWWSGRWNYSLTTGCSLKHFQHKWQKTPFLKLQGLLFSIDICLLCLYKSSFTISLCLGETWDIFRHCVSAVEQNSNIITSVMGIASHVHKPEYDLQNI